MQVAYIDKIEDDGDGGVEEWSRVCLSCNIKDFRIYCRSGSNVFLSFACVVEQSTSLTTLKLSSNLSSPPPPLPPSPLIHCVLTNLDRCSL